jgi:hypothetical protein
MELLEWRTLSYCGGGVTEAAQDETMMTAVDRNPRQSTADDLPKVST